MRPVGSANRRRLWQILSWKMRVNGFKKEKKNSTASSSRTSGGREEKRRRILGHAKSSRAAGERRLLRRPTDATQCVRPLTFFGPPSPCIAPLIILIMMWAVFPHPSTPPPRPRWDVLWGRHKGTASHSVRASFPPRAGLWGRPRLPNIRFHPRAEGSVWLPGLAACHEILYCPTATHLSPSPVTLICNLPAPLSLCLPLPRGMDPSFPPSVWLKQPHATFAVCPCC